MSLLAVGIDYLQKHATLSDKTLGHNLHYARKVYNTGTSSYKYFVLQALVQEATESETAWSTLSESLLPILVELQKDNKLAAAMCQQLASEPPKARKAD